MSRRLSRLGTIGVVVILLLGMADGVRADTIAYNNFGAANGGNDYVTTNGWTVGNFSGDNVAVGETFTPSQTGTLSTIVMALEFALGTNAATISLRADASGVPGAVLESFSVSGLPPLDSAFHTPTTVTDTINAALVAGSPYWVVASTSISNLLGWMFSDSATGNHAESFSGGSTWFPPNTENQGAFRVTENLPVPEPSTLALLIIGVGSLAGNWLRRRCRG